MRPIDLEDFLPFLINRVSGRITASFTEAIASTGLSLAEVRTMRALYARPEMRLTELSAATDAEISTLSRLVRRLTRKGFCKVETRGSDARIGSVSLSPEGQALIGEIEKLGSRHERSLTEGLSADDIAAAKMLLRKIYQNALAEWR
jgi:DNA-binding MarR family transcriptional regulator